MAYTTINKGSLHMNTKLYTGDSGTNNSITGIGFKPDMVWLKNRTGSGNHFLWDVVRGANKTIVPNDTDIEETSSYLGSFDTDGFTLTSASNNTNSSSYTYASWNWKAGNSQGSSNTDGSINTAYTSVNTTAGFSISKYTGTGSNATVGHGLGSAPKIIILKNLNATQPWWTYSEALGAGKQLRLSGTDAAGNDGGVIWNNTAPTSSVFSVGTNTGSNGSSNNIIAYCFAEKTGYSKFGSYIGNGNADGKFVYTGFKPAFVIIKRSSSGGDDWVMYDNKRNTFNVLDKRLNPNSSGAEQSTDIIDFVSNGFKLKGTPDYVNGNDSTYIYMAFAEAPLVGTNNVPCTAR